MSSVLYWTHAFYLLLKPPIITTTKVVVCTDPRRVITGFTPKGASKVWHCITLTGRR